MKQLKRSTALFCGVVIIALVAVTSAHAETYFFHTDHLGTPQVLTDNNQTVVWQAEYDPFGKATETVTTVEQNLRFPGQYLDRKSGLHYNYFRTYDPSIGRYTQSDPIGLGGGINTYGYAYQNPVSNYDPDGRLVWFVNPWTVNAAFAMTTAGAAWWAIDHQADQSNPIDNLVFAKPPADASDPDGAKAPGKPGDDEGFCSPKRGDDWVRNPNGRGNGWLDADGNVWVPTGPGGEAHGGPHWDVQTPGGGYINVYPGGKRRL